METETVKGAPEIVSGLCKNIENNVSKTDIENQLVEYQNQAMRILVIIKS